MRQLVVDTDTGIDDALALVLLASRPDVALVAVGTAHGNCSTEQSTANAAAVLRACGRGNVPVVGGLSAPLVGELSVAWLIHGHDGLGDCGVAPPPAPPAPPGHTAAERDVELARARPGELDLLALGPLTNLGAALRADPGVLAGFRSVTVMGGVGRRRPPEAPDPTGGVGDANTYHDPEAARLVAAAPGRVTLVGIDVTMGCAAGPAELSRLAAATTDHGRLASRIVQRYADAYEERDGARRLTLHDPLAAMVAVDVDVGARFAEGPTTVDGPAGHERVVLTGEGDGGPPRRVVTAVDARRAVEVLLSALERPLPEGA